MAYTSYILRSPSWTVICIRKQPKTKKKISLSKAAIKYRKNSRKKGCGIVSSISFIEINLSNQKKLFPLALAHNSKKNKKHQKERQSNSRAPMFQIEIMLSSRINRFLFLFRLIAKTWKKNRLRSAAKKNAGENAKRKAVESSAPLISIEFKLSSNNNCFLFLSRLIPKNLKKNRLSSAAKKNAG